MDISVVIPVYGCPECLKELHARLVAALETITPDFEIILVNDGCPRNSWETVREIALSDARVVGIDLSRNFGQFHALTAGLDRANGHWVMAMDCDLQDLPEEIPKLHSKGQEGYDVVLSRRAERKDSAVKRLCSSLFYRLLGYLTGDTFDASISNFSMCRDYVLDAFLQMREQNRSFVLFLMWLGFRTAIIDVQHGPRAASKSSYSLGRQLKLAWEIISAHSNRPLTLSMNVGLVMSAISLLYVVFLVIQKLVHGITVPGWTTTVASIYFVGGLILASLGMVGRYVGYVFDQTKSRPLYVVREIVENRASRLGGGAKRG